MQWLNRIVDEIETRYPAGKLLIESGASPSGTYHFGHLREIIACDAILLELQKRGREVQHVHFVDDLDALRKIPANVPQNYEKYLGQSLTDIPAPDGSKLSYAEYFLKDFTDSADVLGIKMEVIRSHRKYRAGFFTDAIEIVLEHTDKARHILETVSGHKLGDDWTPIQVNEDGYLKKRPFISIDTAAKTIQYKDKEGKEQTTSYAQGEVKLDWRFDWPARWWLLHINVELAGRDHSTKGGSFDTGLQILRDIFETEPLVSMPYDFVNLAGDPKKMSASRGTGIDATEIVQVLPPEVIRFFMLRYSPNKRLYFDPIDGVIQLMDEFAALAAKDHRTADEQQLLYVCTNGQKQQTVSRVPFSHLVASYQASLKDVAKTLEVIKRTEHGGIAAEEAQVIKNELAFIDVWLDKHAPENVKFSLSDKVDKSRFSDKEIQFLQGLAKSVEQAPDDADGQWFHQAIYSLQNNSKLSTKELFGAIYKATISKTSGPRAGYFLSILPRDWLIKRLSLES